jgi:hypothetical protein
MGQQQKPEPELLEIPGAEGQSVDYLTNVLQNYEAPTQNIPLMQTAGLTGTEQIVQDMLKKYLATSPTESKAYQLGLGEIEKTLGGEFYDPKSSGFWEGFRELSEMEQEKGVANLRRRGQLGGGLYSEPSERAESEYIRGMGAERTKLLGSLYESERNRMTNAVAQALGYAGFEEQGETSRLQLGSTIGAIPRQIEQQKYTAEHAQKLGQTQADYQSDVFGAGMQMAAAESLKPQWYIDQSQPADPLGGVLGIVSTLATIGK